MARGTSTRRSSGSPCFPAATRSRRRCTTTTSPHCFDHVHLGFRFDVLRGLPQRAARRRHAQPAVVGRRAGTASRTQHGAPMTEAPSVTVVVVSEERCEDTLAALDGLHHLSWPLYRLEIVVVTSRWPSTRASIRTVVPTCPSRPGGGRLRLRRGLQPRRRRGVGAVPRLRPLRCPPRPGLAEAAIGALDRGRRDRVCRQQGALLGRCPSGLRRRVVDEHGLPWQPHQGASDDGRYDERVDVLYPSSAAMVLPAAVFRQLGGFDDGYAGPGAGGRPGLAHLARRLPGPLRADVDRLPPRQGGLGPRRRAPAVVPQRARHALQVPRGSGAAPTVLRSPSAGLSTFTRGRAAVDPGSRS